MAREEIGVCSLPERGDSVVRRLRALTTTDPSTMLQNWKSWLLPRSTNFRVEPVPHGSLHLPSNEFSTTVFTGEAPEWLEYLQLDRADRYEPEWDIEIALKKSEEALGFTGRNESSKLLAVVLEDGYLALLEVLGEKPGMRGVLRDLVLGNDSNFGTRVILHVSRRLPSLASREVSLDQDGRAGETHIVLDRKSVDRTLELVQNYRGKGAEKAKVRLDCPGDCSVASFRNCLIRVHPGTATLRGSN